MMGKKEITSIIRREVREALKDFFQVETIDLSQDENLIVSEDKSKKVPVAKVIMPMVGFDRSTGKYFTLGTWSQPQTFNDDITLAMTKKLILDTDGDSYITCDSDDVWRFYAGGSIRFSLTPNPQCSKPINYAGNAQQNVGYTEFDEIATDPTSRAGHGHLYVKDAAGVTKLYFRKDDATIEEVAFV